jgi:signal transduction histidine kinase/ligand-binding sensor domain-containing protein
MCVMDGMHRQGPGVVALGTLLAYILRLACPDAFALDPALDVSQYAHTSWRIRDGFPQGQIQAIAQTPDGYLWLGSEFGLLRFDGIRSLPWQPPGDQRLPSNFIMSLRCARDGTLWIGTQKGLASWKDGRLTQYPELAELYIFAIVEDREGLIWASGLNVLRGKLCAIRNGSVQCYGDDGVLGRGAFNLYEDSKGNLWAGVKNGLWRWKPGPPKFYPLDGEPDGIQGLGEDDDGTLLVGWNGGLWRLVDGHRQPYPLPRTIGKFQARRLFRDRDGGLWIGTGGRGLVHVHRGRADVFTTSDGLSGERVHSIFEDREGSIWASTVNGLDRFRDRAVSTLSTRHGLSSDRVVSVAAAKDGSIWLATQAGLSRGMHGQIVNYGERRHLFATGKGERARSLNELDPLALFQDDRERVWVSTINGFGYLEDGRFLPVDALPGGAVNAIVQDGTGSLWVANERAGLFRLLRGNVDQHLPWSKLGDKGHASAMAADPSGNGLWIGFHLGGVVYLTGTQVRASYSTDVGLGKGRVNYLEFDRRGALWAATGGGLSRLKDGRVATLTTGNGLPCDTVHWIVEDNVNSYWLYTACGLVRIAGAELDMWAAAVDEGKDSKQTIEVTVFNESDGVRVLAGAGHFSGQVAKSTDGKLWFLPGDGVSFVDPGRLPFNKLPPPVLIENIVVDRKTYAATSDGKGLLRLPALSRDLQIDYTALSLVAPERVRFRYKLEGHDLDWQDAGTRRQAFYNDLPPRNYRFRVIASNNSGLWNEAGDTLEFSIEPAYYQTNWFRTLMAVLVFGTAWALHRFRLHQIAREHNVRIEERVGERTRIARDLHDTLLQSFQGLLFEFQAARNLFPRRPEEAIRTLDDAIGGAKAAITEGRDAIQNLRSGSAVHTDLAQLLATAGKELSDAQDSNVNSAVFRLTVEGPPQTLSPVIQDEVYRIGREILRNAFRHARAGKIEVEIRYDGRLLRLRIRDDGIGIDPKVLGEKACAGHWGLPGVRERAKLVGAKLDFWSEAGAGTEVQLVIPASVAYQKSPRARVLGLFSKATRSHAK